MDEIGAAIVRRDLDVGTGHRELLVGICLVAIAAGLAIADDIRHDEPIEGEGGRPDRFEKTAEWALPGASMADIAYCAMLLVALVLLRFDADSPDRRSVVGALTLAIPIAIGLGGGLTWLKHAGRSHDRVQSGGGDRCGRRVLGLGSA